MGVTLGMLTAVLGVVAGCPMRGCWGYPFGSVSVSVSLGRVIGTGAVVLLSPRFLPHGLSTSSDLEMRIQQIEHTFDCKSVVDIERG